MGFLISVQYDREENLCKTLSLVGIIYHCIFVSTVETVQSNLNLFTNRRYSSGPFLQRQGSITSNISQMSGLGESAVSFITGGQYPPLTDHWVSDLMTFTLPSHWPFCQISHWLLQIILHVLSILKYKYFKWKNCTCVHYTSFNKPEIISDL